MNEWVIEQNYFDSDECLDRELHPKYDERAFRLCDGWHRVYTYDRMGTHSKFEEKKIPHTPLALEEALAHMIRIREFPFSTITTKRGSVIDFICRMRLRNLRTNEIVCEEIVQR